MATDRPILPFLPSAISAPSEGGDLISRLTGAKIVRIGSLPPGEVEGGGLVIDYIPANSSGTVRVILALNDLGAWVDEEYSL